MLCVTGYAEPGSADTQFYRAQITHLNKEEQTANVLFIDFGNREKKKLSQLFELSAELQEYPFQAIQCKIANIKISLFKNPNGTWTKAATSKFASIVHTELNKSNTLKLRILYLNKANVGYCTLYSCGGSDSDYSDIGQLLVESGYADATPIEPILKKKSSSSHYLYVPSRKSDYIRTKPHVTSGDNDLVQLMQRTKLNSNLSSISVDDLNKTELSMRRAARANHSDDEDVASSIADSYNTENTSHLGFFDENNDEDESAYSGIIELNGPYSPLECNYFSIVNIGHGKRSRVERNSINYVTLDDDPTNESSRLMVASEVTLNASGQSMILRKTSVMPKLPGLASLCSLLFSPSVEFRVNPKKTCYTGALCGLGFDEDGCAIYTDNDIESTFDVNIDISDITMVI